MLHTIASEARKLRATPTMWWLLLGVVGTGVAATLGAVVLDNARHLVPTSDHALRDYMHSAGTGSILVVIAGIIGMAGEFRFGQADQTFLSTPKRRDVVWAKTLVFTVVGAVFGVTASLASLATTWIWLSTKGYGLPLGHEAIWLTIIGAVVSAILFAVLGVALGAASRNQVPAVVATVAWFVVLEPIFKQMSDAAARWLPGNAALALRRVPESGLLSMRTGAIVLAAWTAAALVVGIARTIRQDIA
jgi:ABC-2 type transport system permease protein